MSAKENPCESCSSGDCGAKQQRSGESSDAFLERQEMAAALCSIKHKVMVLSGKGGVGKSTVAVNLAASLAAKGLKTGLLDVDIHGPSVPVMLGLTEERVLSSGEKIFPITRDNLKIMSIGFLLKDRDSAVIWRGPMKMGVIKQFLKDVDWGELDYLVIDSPPGTGDEPLSVCQLIENADGAVIVTTPQDVAVTDVRRSIRFCRQLDLPVLGVVENMSGFVCPECGKKVDIFKSNGGRKMSEEARVPFLGAIPIDMTVVSGGDDGSPFVEDSPDSVAAGAFSSVVGELIKEVSCVKRNKENAK